MKKRLKQIGSGLLTLAMLFAMGTEAVAGAVRYDEPDQQSSPSLMAEELDEQGDAPVPEAEEAEEPGETEIAGEEGGEAGSVFALPLDGDMAGALRFGLLSPSTALATGDVASIALQMNPTGAFPFDTIYNVELTFAADKVEGRPLLKVDHVADQDDVEKLWRSEDGTAVTVRVEALDTSRVAVSSITTVMAGFENLATPNGSSAAVRLAAMAFEDGEGNSYSYTWPEDAAAAHNLMAQAGVDWAYRAVTFKLATSLASYVTVNQNTKNEDGQLEFNNTAYFGTTVENMAGNVGEEATARLQYAIEIEMGEYLLDPADLVFTGAASESAAVYDAEGMPVQAGEKAGGKVYVQWTVEAPAEVSYTSGVGIRVVYAPFAIYEELVIPNTYIRAYVGTAAAYPEGVSGAVGLKDAAYGVAGTPVPATESFYFRKLEGVGLKVAVEGFTLLQASWQYPAEPDNTVNHFGAATGVTASRNESYYHGIFGDPMQHAQWVDVSGIRPSRNNAYEGVEFKVDGLRFTVGRNFSNEANAFVMNPAGFTPGSFANSGAYTVTANVYYAEERDPEGAYSNYGREPVASYVFNFDTNGAHGEMPEYGAHFAYDEEHGLFYLKEGVMGGGYWLELEWQFTEVDHADMAANATPRVLFSITDLSAEPSIQTDSESLRGRALLWAEAEVDGAYDERSLLANASSSTNAVTTWYYPTLGNFSGSKTSELRDAAGNALDRGYVPGDEVFYTAAYNNVNTQRTLLLKDSGAGLAVESLSPVVVRIYLNGDYRDTVAYPRSPLLDAYGQVYEWSGVQQAGSRYYIEATLPAGRALTSLNQGGEGVVPYPYGEGLEAGEEGCIVYFADLAELGQSGKNTYIYPGDEIVLAYSMEVATGTAVGSDVTNSLYVQRFDRGQESSEWNWVAEDRGRVRGDVTAAVQLEFEHTTLVKNEPTNAHLYGMVTQDGNATAATAPIFVLWLGQFNSGAVPRFTTTDVQQIVSGVRSYSTDSFADKTVLGEERTYTYGVDYTVQVYNYKGEAVNNLAVANTYLVVRFNDDIEAAEGTLFTVDVDGIYTGGGSASSYSPAAYFVPDGSMPADVVPHVENGVAYGRAQLGGATTSNQISVASLLQRVTGIDLSALVLNQAKYPYVASQAYSLKYGNATQKVTVAATVENLSLDGTYTDTKFYPGDRVTSRFTLTHESHADSYRPLEIGHLVALLPQDHILDLYTVAVKVDGAVLDGALYTLRTDEADGRERLIVEFHEPVALLHQGTVELVIDSVVGRVDASQEVMTEFSAYYTPWTLPTYAHTISGATRFAPNDDNKVPANVALWRDSVTGTATRLYAGVAGANHTAHINPGIFADATQGMVPRADGSYEMTLAQNSNVWYEVTVQNPATQGNEREQAAMENFLVAVVLPAGFTLENVSDRTGGSRKDALLPIEGADGSVFLNSAGREVLVWEPGTLQPGEEWFVALRAGLVSEVFVGVQTLEAYLIPKEYFAEWDVTAGGMGEVSGGTQRNLSTAAGIFADGRTVHTTFLPLEKSMVSSEVAINMMTPLGATGALSLTVGGESISSGTLDVHRRDTLAYSSTFENRSGDTAYNKIAIVQELPFVGDANSSGWAPALSTNKNYSVRLGNAAVPASAYKVYLLPAGSAYDTTAPAGSEGWVLWNRFGAEYPGQTAGYIKVEFDESYTLAAGASLTFTWEMAAPADVPFEQLGQGANVASLYIFSAGNEYSVRSATVGATLLADDSEITLTKVLDGVEPGSFTFSFERKNGELWLAYPLTESNTEFADQQGDLVLAVPEGAESASVTVELLEGLYRVREQGVDETVTVSYLLWQGGQQTGEVDEIYLNAASGTELIVTNTKNPLVTYEPGRGTGEAYSEYTPAGAYTLLGNGDTAFTGPYGYDFAGWTTAEGGTEVEFAAGTDITVLADTTLYAVWAHDGETWYTVTYFDGRGGEGVRFNVAPGGRHALYSFDDSALAFEQPYGFDFTGWSADADAAEGELGAGYEIVVDSDIELYAIWKHNGRTYYTVTYRSGRYGVGESTTRRVIPGEEHTLLGQDAAGFTGLPGWGFTGWGSTRDGAAEFSEGAVLRPNSSLTLYAIWAHDDATWYDVAYTAGAGEGEALTKKEAPYTSHVVLDVEDTAFEAPYGFAFTGWKLAGRETLLQAEDTLFMNRGYALEAQWAHDGATWYTVTYHPGAGSGTEMPVDVVPNTMHDLYSQSQTRFAAPNAGYVFLGWSEDPAATLPEYGAGSGLLVDGDKDLYAIWAHDGLTYHTITHHPGAGEGGEAVRFVVPGDSFTAIDAGDAGFTAPYGFMLAGWSLSEGDDTVAYEAGAVFTPEADVDLYAVWAHDGETWYTVTYHDGGEGHTVRVVPGEEHTVLHAQGAGFEGPYGTVFTGWANEADSEVVAHEAGQAIQPEGDVDLYALWAHDGETYYTITYKPGMGTGEDAHALVVPGMAHTLYDAEAAGFTAPYGFEFVGWATEEGGEIALRSGDVVPVSGDRTLYAVWAHDGETWYTVSYHPAEAGGAPVARRVVPGASHTVLSGAAAGFEAPYGFLFTGWAYEEGGEVAVAAGAAITPEADTDLYAVWRHDEATWYTVTYKPGKGAGEDAVAEVVPGSGHALYGQADTGFEAPYGYVFAGWSSQPDAATVEHEAGEELLVDRSLVLYAVWVHDGETWYTVAYESGLHGTGETVARQVAPGAEHTLLGQSDAGFEGLPGWSFKGWSSHPHAESVEYAAGVTLLVEGDITLRAVWEHDGETWYSVAYTAGAGKGRPVTVAEAPYTTHSVYSAAQARFAAPKGYVFLGWQMAGEEELIQPGAALLMSGSYELEAQWAHDGMTWRTVTYKAGAGTGEDVAVQVIPGAQHSLYTAAEAGFTGPIGYRFVGWSENEGATAAEYAAEETIAIAKDRVLYAVWEHDGETWYDVTYTAGVGTGADVTVQVVPYGMTSLYSAREAGFDAPAGHIFAGWLVVGGLLDGTLYNEGAVVQVRTALVLEAQWAHDGRTFNTVTYEAGAGIGGTVAVDVIPGETHSLYTAEQAGFAAPREGYRFMGWSEAPEAVQADHEAGTELAIEEDLVLYAVWAHDGETWYDVTYTAGEGSGADVVVPEVPGATHVVYSVEAAGYTAPEDHVFSGWRVVSGTGELLPGDTLQMEGSYTLEAVWVPDGVAYYTVRYEAGTGSGEPVAVDLRDGTVHELYTEEQAGFDAPYGFVFTGWAEEPGAEEAGYEAGEALAVTGDLVLYAVWAHDGVTYFTLTYDANGGTGEGEVLVIPGEEVTIDAPETFEIQREDHDFAGWALEEEDEADEALAPGEALVLEADLTLFAVWQAGEDEAESGSSSSEGTSGSSSTGSSSSTSNVPGSSSVASSSSVGAVSSSVVSSSASEPAGEGGEGTEEGGTEDAAEGGTVDAPAPEAGPPEVEELAVNEAMDEYEGLTEAERETVPLLGNDVPVGSLTARAGWSLISLMLGILAVLVSVLFGFGMLRRREDGRTARGWKLGAAGMGVVTFIAFLVLENLEGRVMLLSQWTLTILCLFLLQLALAVVVWVRTRKKTQSAEENGGEGQA